MVVRTYVQAREQATQIEREVWSRPNMLRKHTHERLEWSKEAKYSCHSLFSVDPPSAPNVSGRTDEHSTSNRRGQDTSYQPQL